MKEEKKSILASIWEAIIKPGGCWGPAKNCGGSAEEHSEKNDKSKDNK